MDETKRSTMSGKPVFTIPAKQVINFDSGFKHKLLCDGPTFTAGSACAYSCSFCYVPDIMRKSTHMAGLTVPFEDAVIRRDGAVDAIRRQLKTRKAMSLARQPIVIYASPLVDVAANMTLVMETVQMCEEILDQTNWHIRLLSKSNLLPKIAESLEVKDEARAKARMIYGVSTGTLDNKLAAAFEQGTPLVSKRIESLHYLQDSGHRTFGMICPSLPQKDYLAFAKEMNDAIRGNICEHVWAEVINVRGASMVRTIKALEDAGYGNEADDVQRVSENKVAWEEYARITYYAHRQFIPANKLRFLQYVTPSTRGYWKQLEGKGAVVL